MYRLNNPFTMRPSVDSNPRLMKVYRKSEVIEMYEKKLRLLKDVIPKHYAAELFDIFLASITVNPHPLNKPDISFAHNYYGIDIKRPNLVTVDEFNTAEESKNE